jgi:hypothetical protein
MKTSLRRSLKRRRLLMTSRSSNLILLAQRRRSRRALHFFADLLGGGRLHDVAALGAPLPDVKHLPRLRMDLAVTRDPAPKHMRAILAFARRRQLGFILVRFRDPAPGLAEALVDAVFFDTGLAILDCLSPATADGRRWHLVGRHKGDVHLKLTGEGMVPTVAEPWLEEEDRHSFVSKADHIFAEYLWRA